MVDIRLYSIGGATKIGRSIVSKPSDQLVNMLLKRPLRLTRSPKIGEAANSSIGWMVDLWGGAKQQIAKSY